MTEIDPSLIIKDGDCIYFRGVKYRKVKYSPPEKSPEGIKKVIEATMELTLRPQQGDRAKVIAAALKEVREMLSTNHPTKYIDEGHFLYTLGYFDCLKDIDKLVEELEND